MPIIKSAHKKLRQDKKRHDTNELVKDSLKKAVREARRDPSPKNLSAAFSALDTAAKKNVIHDNKAARLKSRLAHSVKPATS